MYPDCLGAHIFASIFRVAWKSNLHIKDNPSKRTVQTSQLMSKYMYSQAVKKQATDIYILEKQQKNMSNPASARVSITKRPYNNDELTKNTGKI